MYSNRKTVNMPKHRIKKKKVERKTILTLQ